MAQANLLRDVPAPVWTAIALLALAGAICLHAVLPRYQFEVIGADGKAMIIHDRWTGRFQRAMYDERGEPTLTRVLTPF
jgi:hypothetical protein